MAAVAEERADLALRIFEWAVVRQSDLGPGLSTCAKAFGVSVKDVSIAVAGWRDPRGHMSLAEIRQPLTRTRVYRIEAYYNTSG